MTLRDATLLAVRRVPAGQRILELLEEDLHDAIELAPLAVWKMVEIAPHSLQLCVAFPGVRQG